MGDQYKLVIKNLLQARQDADDNHIKFLKAHLDNVVLEDKQETSKAIKAIIKSEQNKGATKQCKKSRIHQNSMEASLIYWYQMKPTIEEFKIPMK